MDCLGKMTEKNKNIKEKRIRIQEKGDFEILLGSSPDCKYALNDFDKPIAPEHAALKRIEDRLFLKDLGTPLYTYINGKKVGSKWHEITLQDEVRLGEVPVEITPTILLGRERVSLNASDLYLTVPDKGNASTSWPDLDIKNIFKKASPKVLVNHTSLEAIPGTLTGIMGPSGSGKTVLLKLMAGYLRPEQGKVMVGHFNVYESFGLIREIIGYVPQEDTLFPQLTVWQSLHYCLRLRYPDMKSEKRRQRIEYVLVKMGFADIQLKTLLNTKIGRLSGGERKRVDIAHELVRDPLLLFLDEPTSGLSSVDSELIVSTLRKICDTYKITMLMTIHQPSRAIYDELDNLVLINDGNVVYFGPANKSVAYFEELAGKECGAANPANYVLKVLDQWHLRHSPEKYYLDAQSKIWPYEQIVGKTDESNDLSADDQKKMKRKSYPLLHQFFLLLARNIRIKYADKASLMILFSQAIIIALLLLGTFNGFQGDYQNTDSFTRTWFSFIPKYRDKGTALNLASLRDESKYWANSHKDFIGEQSAHRRASILFLLIASSIWFGVINGSREIVSEQSVLQRETKGSLSVFSYLMAKFYVLCFIAVIQTGILLGLSYSLLTVRPSLFLQFWFILFLTSIAASSLSLLISVLVKTEQAALMTVPLLIIPQLFLGGFIRPLKYLSGRLVENVHLSDLILAKWSFKGLLLYDSIVNNNILIQQIGGDNKDTINYLSFEKRSITDVFFDISASQDIHYIIFIIILHALIPLILTYLSLKKRYT